MPIRLIAAEIEQLAVSPGAAIYTVPANTTSQVVACVAANTDSVNAVQFAIEINSGGGLADYIPNRTLGPQGTDLCPEIVGMVLETGDIVQGLASSASDVNLKLSIKEIT